MSDLYIGWEIAVLLNCIDSIHRLPYKLYFQKFTFYVLYSPNLQILKCLKDQFFFLKQLQIYSDLFCQIVEIPSLYYSSFNLQCVSAWICIILLGKKTVGCYQLPFQNAVVTIKQSSLGLCYPGPLHRSDIVAVTCIQLCCFVSFFSQGQTQKCKNIIQLLWKLRQGAHTKFQACLGYPGSSRPSWAVQ